jgi:hypothetical protein
MCTNAESVSRRSGKESFRSINLKAAKKNKRLLVQYPQEEKYLVDKHTLSCRNTSNERSWAPDSNLWSIPLSSGTVQVA